VLQQNQQDATTKSTGCNNEINNHQQLKKSEINREQQGYL
jgi:hypothetical protein